MAQAGRSAASPSRSKSRAPSSTRCPRTRLPPPAAWAMASRTRLWGRSSMSLVIPSETRPASAARRGGTTRSVGRDGRAARRGALGIEGYRAHLLLGLLELLLAALLELGAAGVELDRLLEGHVAAL